MDRTAKKKLKNLLKLGTRLQTVPVEKFNITNWKCGSAACAIGWCPKLVPTAGIKIVDVCQDAAESVWTPQYGGYRCWKAVEAAFGLDEEDSRFLFSMGAYERDNVNSPTVVGKRIVRFAEDKLAETP